MNILLLSMTSRNVRSGLEVQGAMKKNGKNYAVFLLFSAGVLSTAGFAQRATLVYPEKVEEAVIACSRRNVRAPEEERDLELLLPEDFGFETSGAPKGGSV